MNFSTRWFGLAILAVVGFVLYTRWTRKTDLQIHMLEEQSLNNAGQTVNLLDNVALTGVPLTTIGGTPLAGLEPDPFNRSLVGSNPNILSWAQSIVQPRPRPLTDYLTSWMN